MKKRTKKAPSHTIATLERQNKMLKRLGREYFIEMTERGKELERIRRIVDGCDDQMSPEVLDMLWEPLNKYIDRCSAVGKGKREPR